ncbi:MAG: hypothetical protein QGI88_13025, partial [SAR202 cluster bacterium]|nr:hypothetical protein [SAR202 cluster bacterium]
MDLVQVDVVRLKQLERLRDLGLSSLFTFAPNLRRQVELIATTLRRLAHHALSGAVRRRAIDQVHLFYNAVV